jgi:CheY-like chemotaxis protein
MATIEAGKVALENREFDPASMLRDVRSLFQNQAAAKGLLLELECDPALPSRLLGDPLRIKQVLINLAGNGVKFTQRGRITLGVRLKTRDGTSALAQFFVADTGIGITAEDIERIVSSSFELGDNSHTRAYGGTGLGLAISRNLINMMGGQLEISSVPGQGSTFSFSVRLKFTPPAAQPVADTPAGKRFPLSGVRVLVADDEMINQEIIRELLLMEGMKVDLAENGGKAVDLARHNHYELILLDLQMPVLDGPQASVLIRQISHHATTPIVALTSESLAETRAICLGAGMNAQIAKPFDPDQLIATIEHWLNAARASP